MKYGIYMRKVDTFELLARFEQLAQSLDKVPIAENKDERVANLDPKNAFLQQLQTLAFEFIDLSKKARDNLTEEEREALEKLEKNDSIVISKADKGNAVVIQNLDDYRKKLVTSLTLLASLKKSSLTQLLTEKRQTQL